MKSILYFTLILLNLNSYAYKFSRPTLACLLGGIAGASLAKDASVKTAIASGVCLTAYGYELMIDDQKEVMDRVDLLDEKVTAFMDDALKRIKNNHQKASRAYKLYRKVIRKSVAKKINDVKKDIMNKLDTKGIERRVARRVDKKFEDKIVKSVEAKVKEMLKNRPEGISEEDVMKIVDQKAPLIFKEMKIQELQKENQMLRTAPVSYPQ